MRVTRRLAVMAPRCTAPGSESAPPRLPAAAGISRRLGPGCLTRSVSLAGYVPVWHWLPKIAARCWAPPQRKRERRPGAEP